MGVVHACIIVVAVVPVVERLAPLLVNIVSAGTIVGLFDIQPVGESEEVVHIRTNLIEVVSSLEAEKHTQAPLGLCTLHESITFFVFVCIVRLECFSQRVNHFVTLAGASDDVVSHVEVALGCTIKKTCRKFSCRIYWQIVIRSELVLDKLVILRSNAILVGLCSLVWCVICVVTDEASEHDWLVLMF